MFCCPTPSCIELVEIHRGIAANRDASEEAFAALVDRFKPLVLGLASKFSTKSPLLKPPDLSQEAWVKLVQQLPKWDPARGEFCGWVHKVVTNHFIAQLRKEKKESRTVHTDRPPDPGYWDRHAHEHEAVRRYLDTRAEEDVREFAELRYFEGLDLATIAARMNIGLTTAKLLHQKLKDGLRRDLGDDYLKR